MQGDLGAVIHDEEFVTTVRESMRSISKVTEELGPEGAGMLARLIHSKKLGDEVASAIGAISQISQDINNGPGTLHSLIKDPSLFNDARETLTLLRDSTEDLREQEPVTAFFSILFAPF